MADLSTFRGGFRHNFCKCFNMMMRNFAFVKQIKEIKVMKKTITFLSWMFIVLLTSVSFSSCKDDDEPGLDKVNPAAQIVGQYEGTLSAGLEQVRAYVVITPETKTEIKLRLVCNTLEIDDVYPCYAEVDERTMTYNIDSDAYYLSGYIKDDKLRLTLGEKGTIKFEGTR